MTKRHFEAFARYIRESNCSVQERANMAHCVAYISQAYNSRFDLARFWKACGLESAK